MNYSITFTVYGSATEAEVTINSYSIAMKALNLMAVVFPFLNMFGNYFTTTGGQ